MNKVIISWLLFLRKFFCKKVFLIRLSHMKTHFYSISEIPEDLKQFTYSLQRISKYSSLWQTFGWQSMLCESNQISSSYFYGMGDWDIVAYACIEIRSLWLWFEGAFIVGGPYLSESLSDNEKDTFFHSMKDILQKQLPGILFLQYESLQEGIYYFKKQVYKAFIEPYTRCIDLTQDEDDILNQMHEKWRYNIRLAIKRGVTVERVDASRENIDTFFHLLLETTKRDGFAHNSRAYYESMLRFLESENMGGLYFAYNQEKKMIAAWIFVFLGNTALYYYGASTSDSQERKHMPAYLLQWQAMLDGKKFGCKIYDFLWIAPDESIHHHLTGVTDFKKKFGWYTQVFDAKGIFIYRSTAYTVYKIIRTIKRGFRSLLRK